MKRELQEYYRLTIVSLVENLENVAEVTRKRFRSNEADTKLMAGIIQIMKASVGSPPFSLDVKFVSPSSWGATSLVADEVACIDKALSKLLEQDLVSMRNQWHSANECKMADISDLKKSAGQIKELITRIMMVIRQLSPDLDNVKSTLKIVVSDLNAIRADMEQTSTRRYGDSDQQQRNAAQPATYSGPSDKDIESMIEDQFNILVNEIEILRSTDLSAVTFGDLGFRNLEECRVWADDHFTDRRYGLIMDPLIMLDRIYGDDAVDQFSANTWRTMDARMKMKVTTGAEASAMESLNNPRPRLFHTGRPTMVFTRNTSRLSKLLSHSVWNSGGEGTRAFIVKQMNVLSASILQDTNHAFGRSPLTAKAYMVASLALSATTSSTNQLLSAIDTLYDKLHVKSKFSAEGAWCLAMQVLDRICEDLYSPQGRSNQGCPTWR